MRSLTLLVSERRSTRLHYTSNDLPLVKDCQVAENIFQIELMAGQQETGAAFLIERLDQQQDFIYLGIESLKVYPE